jgi:hypothetical protein
VGAGDFLDEALQTRMVADIEGGASNRAAGGAQRAGQLLQGRGVAGAQRHVRTFAGEAGGDGRTDAPAGPGDERDAAGKTHGGAPPWHYIRAMTSSPKRRIASSCAPSGSEMSNPHGATQASVTPSSCCRRRKSAGVRAAMSKP